MVFSKLLIEQAGVAVAPGVGFGEYGEGYVRIGLVENEHLCQAIAARLGLPAAKSSVLTLGDTSYIVIERFDRRFNAPKSGAELRAVEPDLADQIIYLWFGHVADDYLCHGVSPFLPG